MLLKRRVCIALEECALHWKNCTDRKDHHEGYLAGPKNCFKTEPSESSLPCFHPKEYLHHLHQGTLITALTWSMSTSFLQHLPLLVAQENLQIIPLAPTLLPNTYNTPKTPMNPQEREDGDLQWSGCGKHLTLVFGVRLLNESILMLEESSPCLPPLVSPKQSNSY